MDEKLTKKIEWVKGKLRGQEVQELALFDVKEGQDGEDGAPYYKTYLDQTTASMGALFKKTEWGKLTPWEKLCCYKISESAGVDCDAALRSTVIYKLAFGGDEIVPKKKIYLLKHNGFILRGDTMNSYATTVREYLRSYDHEKKRVEAFLNKRGKDAWEVHDCSKKNWEVCVLEHYNYFSEIIPSPAARGFFGLYHTVGNFIPWPDGCNVPRGSGPVKDYWDLTLYRIYQWYQANKDLAMPKNDVLLKLFGSQMVAFPNWLASFGSWDNFVRRNYMQDFVYGEDGRTEGAKVPDDGHFGPPMELWRRHFTNGVMPKGTDFEQFFTNASAWIAARGERIARAVKAALAAEKSAAAREARP